VGCGDPSAAPDAHGSDAGRPGADAHASTDGGLLHDAPLLDAPANDASLGPTDGGATTGLVPVFIAQGKLGRITISCDDGHTWAYDHSELPTGRCWDSSSPNNVECDHHEWSSLGLAAGDGYFYATWGWGHPGTLRRSADGVVWEDVLGGHTFAGIAFGNGYLLANDRPTLFSSSAGAAGSWTMGSDITSPVWNLRSIDFIAYGPGRFLASLDSGATDLILSDDHGMNWRSATARPSTCTGPVAYGNGIVISAHGGSVCRSEDGGDHFTEAVVTTDVFSSAPYFFDGAFHLYADSTLLRSTDGTHWDTIALTPSSISIGVVAQSPVTGALVGIRTQWGAWYETQQFYRSVDGIAWEVLAPTAFHPSHPITDVIAGYAMPSAVCPHP